MRTLIHIFLVAPALLPKEKTAVELRIDSDFAIVAFFAFLVLLYLVLSLDRTRKSRIRSR